LSEGSRFSLTRYLFLSFENSVQISSSKLNMQSMSAANSGVYSFPFSVRWSPCFSRSTAMSAPENIRNRNQRDTVLIRSSKFAEPVGVTLASCLTRSISGWPNGMNPLSEEHDNNVIENAMTIK